MTALFDTESNVVHDKFGTELRLHTEITRTFARATDRSR